MACKKLSLLIAELILFPVVALFLLCIYPGLPPPLTGKKNPPPRSTVPLEGPLGLNEDLDEAQFLFKGQLFGPESFAAKDGRIYSGVLGGNLVSFDANNPSEGVLLETRIAPPCPSHNHAFEENVCGRILGLRFDASGDLIMADAYYGLYKWNLDRAEPPIPLVPSTRLIDGRPNLITNSLTVSKKTEGFIYFTTSSTWFSLNSSMLEILGPRPTGRVMRYDPRDGSVETLVDDVPFANGIQLSVDESFLVFASCGHWRVYKHHLKGEKKGLTEVFFDPPGVPDNVTPSPDGGFFVGVVAVETERRISEYIAIPSPLKLLREYPTVRFAYGNLLANLMHLVDKLDTVFPSPLLKTVKHLVGNTETGARLAPPHALVVELDAEGRVVKALHGTRGRLNAVCEGFVHGDWMYLGSPYQKMDFVARLPLR